MSHLVISEDPDVPEDFRPRIIVNFDQRMVRFEACHEARVFFSFGVQTCHDCSFDDIRGVTDFLTGDHRGVAIRTLLAAGTLVNVSVAPEELSSMFISTRTGRCRVFSNWTNYARLREALRDIVPDDARPHWSDNPRLIPLFAVILLVIVAVLISLLL